MIRFVKNKPQIPNSYLKNMVRQFALVFAALLVFMSSCEKGDDRPVSVSGTVTGAKGQKLLLEYLGIRGVTLQDSLTLDENGKFDFKASAPEYPDYFRLRLGREVIPFAADSLDRLQVTADASAPGVFSGNYSIEGNELNPEIQKVWALYQKAASEIAGLLKQYSAGKLSIFDYGTLRETKLRDYRENVKKMIYDDPSAPSSYFGLMQQIDGDYIFNPIDPEGSRLFATVANVMHATDSLSPRAKHLYELALRSVASVRAMRKAAEAEQDSTRVSTPIPTEVVGFIDIKLPDTTGAEKSLKSVTMGGVTLLSFTAMAAVWAPEFNKMIAALYNRYHGQGLQIYQVDMDGDRHAWLNVVKDQPWVNVIETRGNASEYIGYYGLTSLPTLFLIDKGGNIVLRASSVEELEKRISTELAR